MARITVQQAQGWAEGTKLAITALDPDLLGEIETEVIGRLFAIADTSTWVDVATTPALVRTIIAKLYVAWLYDRQYSEDVTEEPNYAARLKENAEVLIIGILNGDIELPGTVDAGGKPVFYPTDASSSLEPTSDDMSLGGPAFSMGRRF